MALMTAGAQAWAKGLETWGKMLGGVTAMPAGGEPERKDRRFAAPEWRENPIFDTIRQTYLRVSDQLLGTVDTIENIDNDMREKLRFATKSFVDAMSPSNFALTNPQVLKRTIETRGENLLKGLANMLKDIASGQLTQTKPGVFEVGRNLATTPGKVVKQTPLYQLIQYTPVTDEVLKTPVVIFPPWINRFYILDLTPEKSFVKWCVDQGISLFMVSWKSADESIAGVGLDDYVLKGQVDAIDTVRDLLGVEAVHAIGYCVAGTTLAATLAYLTAKGEADKVKSATFFTAQVDFSEAGDLKLFLGDETMGLLQQLTAEKGYLDGRYMAATFNLLRGRDLIWSYVVNNYLLGDEPAPFDLLHWNSDTTNLPAGWHRAYLEDLYKGNKLAAKGGINVAGNSGRHRFGEDADLCPGRARGPYRAAAERVEDHEPFRGAEAVRARRLRPYRGSGEPSGSAEVPILGQRRTVRHAGRLRRRSDRAQGKLVARLARMAQEAGWRDGEGGGSAAAGKGQAGGDRGRPRELCQITLKA